MNAPAAQKWNLTCTNMHGQVPRMDESSGERARDIHINQSKADKLSRTMPL